MRHANAHDARPAVPPVPCSTARRWGSTSTRTGEGRRTAELAACEGWGAGWEGRWPCHRACASSCAVHSWPLPELQRGCYAPAEPLVLLCSCSSTDLLHRPIPAPSRPAPAAQGGPHRAPGPALHRRRARQPGGQQARRRARPPPRRAPGLCVPARVLGPQASRLGGQAWVGGAGERAAARRSLAGVGGCACVRGRRCLPPTLLPSLLFVYVSRRPAGATLRRRPTARGLACTVLPPAAIKPSLPRRPAGATRRRRRTTSAARRTSWACCTSRPPTTSACWRRGRRPARPRLQVRAHARLRRARVLCRAGRAAGRPAAAALRALHLAPPHRPSTHRPSRLPSLTPFTPSASSQQARRPTTCAARPRSTCRSSTRLRARRRWRARCCASTSPSDAAAPPVLSVPAASPGWTKCMCTCEPRRGGGGVQTWRALMRGRTSTGRQCRVMGGWVFLLKSSEG